MPDAVRVVMLSMRPAELGVLNVAGQRITGCGGVRVGRHSRTMGVVFRT